MKTVIHNNTRCTAHIGEYLNSPNKIAISLLCEDGPYGTATVNLINERLKENEIILDEPNMPGIHKSLVTAGIVKANVIRMASSGFNVNKYPVVELIINT